MLTKVFLRINRLFKVKKHPFNESQNGIFDLNYTDFEYNHTQSLIKEYSSIIDINVLKKAKVLDVWCWWGWKSIYIAEKFDANVVWIDLNLNFLAQAKQKAQALWVENNVSFFERDALNTWFNNEEFDVLILSDVIEHIPNTKEFLIECFRILKKWWIVLFDFAPYYHYYWHHIWDTIRIPWLHLFTTEKFRINLYKKSVDNLVDWKKRISLRIWLNSNKQESFTYLNKISRKYFETIISDLSTLYTSNKINYYMLKNIKIFSKTPILRETFIRHVVGVIRK